MNRKPRIVKAESYAVDEIGGFPIDEQYASYWIEKYDENGRLIEKIHTEDFSFNKQDTDLVERYEYDEKGRLLYILSNQDEDPQEWYTYDTDEDGNEVEIHSRVFYSYHENESECEVSEIPYTEHLFSIKNPKGVLLAQWELYENYGDKPYYVDSHYEYLYDENGDLSVVIVYGEEELDADGNIISAKELRRLKVTIEKTGDKTVSIWKNDKGEVELEETIEVYRDANGVEHPKLHIKGDGHGDNFHHIEYEYPDDTFDHYSMYEVDWDGSIQRTDYWVED